MKIKFKKTIILLFILSINLTLLSGCFDAREIEDLAYVTALGIDIDDNGILSVTFQISISENSSDSGSSQSSKTKNTTVQCTSINSGISLVNSYISKQINLSHCKAIIFSEKLAANGLNTYIDTLANNVEIRPDCNIIISRCSAKDFIENSKPSIEALTAKYYEIDVKSSEYTGYTTSTEFANFGNNIKSSYIQATAILGGINSGENTMPTPSYVGIDASYKADQSPIDDANKVETFGTAIFYADKFVGELSGLETLCFLLITNKIKTCTISIPSPFEPNATIDISVKAVKRPKITVEFMNNLPNISIDLYLEAYGLTLNNTIDYTSIENIKSLENSTNQYIKNEATNFLYKSSREFNSDIVGFGKYVLSKYSTWKEWEDSKWLENYINSSFNVNVHTQVISGFEFNKSP